jgi:hypothetical protein
MALEIETDGLFADGLTEAVVYTPATGSAVNLSVIPIPGGDLNEMDATAEVRVRRCDFLVKMEDVALVTYTQGRDVITRANGVAFSVLERDVGEGAVYRYLCERRDLEGVQLRGRRRV